MPRWIAFDQATVARLRKQLPREQVFEHGARSVVDFATGGPETLVTVLPLDSGDEAAVAVFRRRKAQLKTAAAQPASANVAPANGELPQMQHTAGQARKAGQVRAGGFLGLRDEEVFEQEPQPQQKKAWWRRFWDEDE